MEKGGKMTQTTKNIKSGGASGAWNNGSNVEGSHSGSCMDSGTDSDAETCLPTQFTEINDTDIINAIRVRIHWGSSDGDDYCAVKLNSTGQGDSSTKNTTTFTGTNCSTAVDEDLGDLSSDVWGWSSPVGTDVNGTDFNVVVTQMKSGKQGSCYVDYIEITIDHSAAPSGDFANKQLNRDLNRDLNAGLN